MLKMNPNAIPFVPSGALPGSGDLQMMFPLTPKSDRYGFGYQPPKEDMFINLMKTAVGVGLPGARLAGDVLSTGLNFYNARERAAQQQEMLEIQRAHLALQSQRMLPYAVGGPGPSLSKKMFMSPSLYKC